MSHRLAPRYAHAALAALLGLLTACGGATDPGRPPETPLVDMRGRYTLGFEANTFLPCGAGRAWWVSSLDSVPAVGAYLTSRPAPAPQRGTTLFVRWRGVLSDSGSYGHLGAYPREFRPREALEVRDTTAADCR